MVAPPKRSPDRCPTHPGAFLRELAEKQPVTPSMAVRLGAVLGTSPASWLNMQTAYDLWHAERDIDTSKIKSLKRAS
jgi:plasmid maintenance system antidote protein VapI